MSFYNCFAGKLITLCCALLFILSTPLYAQEEPLPIPVGKVVWVRGTLKALMPNKEERNLQKASIIYLKDTLMTEKDSQAQIVFTDNSLMTFKPDTKFFIDQYVYKPEKKSVGKFVMQLIEGGFRTITGLVAKDTPNEYQVNTPVATIGVRGTDYAVYLDMQGELFMNYYSGEPCVRNQGGQLCLDSKTQFVRVDSQLAPPTRLAVQPAVFREKLEIVPAKVAPFTSSTGGPTTGTSSGITSPGSGPISSFCITN